MDYTDLYNFQTSSGIIVPDDNSVLLGIQKKFQEIFGTDIDLSAETPVGRLIETMAIVVKSALGVTAQTANQFNVNVATGIYLDAIGQIYDLKRIAGTKTKITIKVFFSQSITDSIPAGALIMSAVNGQIFSIDNTIQNKGEVDSDTGLVYAEGSATAINTGPIVVGEGTVTSIQTSVLGWIGVTNIAPTYIGTDIETDEEFRTRILEARPIGVGFQSSLYAALKRLDGVYSACVLENNTGSTLVKQNVTIPPHSIYVGVDCIETDALKAAIANQIFAAKPIGTGMVNSAISGVKLIAETVRSGYSQEESTVYFYKASRVAVATRIEYRLGGYVGSNVGKDISDIIVNYMDTVGVGGTVYGAAIIAGLITKLKIEVVSIILQKNSPTANASSNVQMDGYEVPYSSTDYITLVKSA